MDVPLRRHLDQLAELFAQAKRMGMFLDVNVEEILAAEAERFAFVDEIWDAAVEQAAQAVEGDVTWPHVRKRIAEAVRSLKKEAA